MCALATTPLGTTGLEITRVGLGAWAIGGGDWAYGWGPQDDRDSIAAIHHAIELGISWIDTAAEYGYGHSEQIVGRALADLPASDRPLVFTKCGLISDPEDRLKPSLQVGDPDSIRREAEASLERLQVEVLDLLQMHWPSQDGHDVEEYWTALAELKAAGKVRFIGMSNHDPGQLDRAEAISHVDVIQPPLSAIDRRAAGDLVPWSREHGTGVIVYSPMQSGLLSGGFSAERAAALAPGDWRRDSSDFTDKLGANLALAAALEPIAERHDVTVASVAIAWTLAWSGVSGAIVGGRRPAQVDGWIDAASLRLTADDLNEIENAIANSKAGEGPANPQRDEVTQR